MILDLDSTVVTVFGHQEQAEVGYNPRYRGKRSYNPLLCLEANSSLLWDTEHDRAMQAPRRTVPSRLLASGLSARRGHAQLRVQADAGFGYGLCCQIWRPPQSRWWRAAEAETQTGWLALQCNRL
ncbi:MAG: hypothetical protein KIS67_16345 [Verrucomicrobiae bacterium]|nr:hypothetical protein [Verrucomicrobiae bacterium]